MCYCGKNPSVIRCANCPPGEDGTPGRSIAWRQTVEAAGANCTYGGFKIEVGFDDDYDGVPDSNVQTTYLCKAAPGDDGATPTLVAGSITALAATDPPTFSLTATGNPNEYAINLGIPVGADGSTPAFVIGTVTTLGAGSSATVAIDPSSTPTNIILNFGIPTGPAGSTDGAAIFPLFAVPACLADLGITSPGSSLNDIIAAVSSLLCSLNSIVTMASNNFRAEKTTIQGIDNGVNVSPYSVKVYFDDDTTLPNNDPSNKFFATKYVAAGTSTKDFGVQNVKITAAAFITQPIQLMIIKNQNIGTPLAQSTAIGFNTMDDFSNKINGGSYVFPPLVAKNIALADGDEIEVYIVSVAAGAGATTMQIEVGAVFSCTDSD